MYNMFEQKSCVIMVFVYKIVSKNLPYHNPPNFFFLNFKVKSNLTNKFKNNKKTISEENMILKRNP